MADLTVNYLRHDHRDLRSVLANLELLGEPEGGLSTDEY